MATPLLDTPLVFDKELKYDDSDANAETRTHIINPPMNLHIWQIGMETQEIVDIARATGQEVVALCGYRWVPKRNPEKYPACDECIRIAGDIMRSRGE